MCSSVCRRNVSPDNNNDDDDDDNHIQEVACKVSRNVGILRKLKFTLPQTCLQLLYNSLVLPYLHYCGIIWGCSSHNKLKSLIVLQKSCTNYCKSRISGTYHSPFQKVQFTEDNGHLSVSNRLLYVQLHYFQITIHV